MKYKQNNWFIPEIIRCDNGKCLNNQAIKLSVDLILKDIMKVCLNICWLSVELKMWDIKGNFNTVFDAAC